MSSIQVLVSGLTRTKLKHSNTGFLSSNITITLQFDFQSWGRGQPDNHQTQGGENCAHLWAWHSGDWSDLPCSQELGYICKKPKGL